MLAQRRGWIMSIRELRMALRELAEASDTYRRCLEDINMGHTVRNLHVARAAYDIAYDKALMLNQGWRAS